MPRLARIRDNRCPRFGPLPCSVAQFLTSLAQFLTLVAHIQAKVLVLTYRDVQPLDSARSNSVRSSRKVFYYIRINKLIILTQEYQIEVFRRTTRPKGSTATGTVTEGDYIAVAG